MLGLSLPPQLRFRNSYAPLSSTSDEDVKDVEEKPRTKVVNDNSETYLALLCILFVFCNMILYTSYKPSLTYDPGVDMSKLQKSAGAQNLRRPSQFPGLDKIVHTGSPPSPIFNFPSFVERVDQAGTQLRESNKIIDDFEADSVEITSSTSTVVHFRTIDWGMERCTLHIQLPGADQMKSNSIMKFGYSGEMPRIKVYKVNTTNHSRYTANDLGDLVGEVDGQVGVEWTYSFPCPNDSLHTFGLMAGDERTRVQWWQNKQTDVPAVYLTQAASV